jgi:hypothetical protein
MNVPATGGFHKIPRNSMNPIRKRDMQPAVNA